MGRIVGSLVLFGLLIAIDGNEPGSVLPLVALVLFTIVVATDALDGYLARKLNQITDFGRVADPMADKILVCGTLIFICASDWGRALLPPWAVVLIVSREFLVTGLRGFIETRGHSFPAGWSGKLKMLAQSVAIPMILLHQVIVGAGTGADATLEAVVRYGVHTLITIVIVLTVYSGMVYMMRAARILNSGKE